MWPQSRAKLYFQPDGSIGLYRDYFVLFVKRPDGSFGTPSGFNATLERLSDDSLRLTFHQSGVIWEFNTGGYLTAIVDRNGNRITAGYSGGNMVSLTDTQGRVITFERDAANEMHTMTDPSGRLHRYGYDANGFLTSYTAPDGKVTTYEYGADSRLSRITDPEGNQTALAYDGMRRVTSITRVTNPTTGSGPTTSFVYDDFSTEVTDARGNTTTYEYDRQSRVTKITDALSHARSTTYTSNSNVQTFTNAGGGLSDLTYDAMNNLTSSKLPTGATSTFAYDNSSHPFNPSRYTTPQGNTIDYTYDTKGNVASSSSGGSIYTMTHNANGTVASVEDPAGAVTSYGYDAYGNLTSIDYAAPLGDTSITVDGLSRVTSLTDGAGRTVTYSYDVLDRVTQVAYTNGPTVSYAYDAIGNRTQRVDSTGTTSYTFDRLNRVTHETLPGGVTYTSTYNPVGNLTSVADSGETTTYAYNAVNLATSLTEPGGAVTSFSYDANNDRTSTSYPNGVISTATYDASQRLKTLMAKKGTTTLTSYDYGYTTSGGADRGLRQSETDTFGEITHFTYDSQERLTAATRTVSGTDGAFGAYAVQYSTSANRSSPTPLQGKTVSGNIYAFATPTTGVSEVRFYIDDPGMAQAPFRTDTAAPFDLAGNSGSNAVAFDVGTLSDGPHVITAAVTLTSGRTEVTSAEFAARSGSPGTAWSYAYDSRSNRTSSTVDSKVTSYVYNAANQLTSSAGVSYTYDGAGNLTGASDGLSLAYNTANQTTSITPPGGAAQSLAYAGTTQYERVTAGPTTFSDNLLGLAARTTGGSVTRTIRDNRGALLGQRTSAGSQYFLFDGLGSVVAVTDASGAVTDRYRYDPYGDTVAHTGATSNPWRYTGAFLDDATGFYKMGLRYYDPDLGRWTQQDAIQNLLQPTQANRYAYVACNPANFTDPTGLFIEDIVGSCALGALGTIIGGGIQTIGVALVFLTPVALPSVGGVVASLTIGCLVGVGLDLIFG